ncbi:hypothetical protein [Novosphingobium sp. BW1]|uniref:hypothetical protein n=1 Tax=Novosphingobium sp. BW1 TaxID=2592621 RepID=UPI0011DEAFA2|nr:hypothetical protein [Novosphingobium sp. BW1]TYC93549.1 hypothetical protein FMM79_01225 [Novosphingobium sp. BW1]
MSSAEQSTSQSPDEFRAKVREQIAQALVRLAGDVPEADARQTLESAISHLADVYARSFGHAETVKTLISITRRGLWPANEELTAPRH